MRIESDHEIVGVLPALGWKLRWIVRDDRSLCDFSEPLVGFLISRQSRENGDFLVRVDPIISTEVVGDEHDYLLLGPEGEIRTAIGDYYSSIEQYEQETREIAAKVKEKMERAKIK